MGEEAVAAWDKALAGEGVDDHTARPSKRQAVARIDTAWGRAHTDPTNAEVWEWVLRYDNAHTYLRGALALATMDGSIDDMTAVGWARRAMGLWFDDIKIKTEAPRRGEVDAEQETGRREQQGNHPEVSQEVR